MRIVSLLPSATEMIFALGLGDSLVGVSHECDYPPEAKGRRVVVRSSFDSLSMTSRAIDNAVQESIREGRSIYELDVDALQELKPDLVITQGICEVCAVPAKSVHETVAKLSKPPIVLSLDPHKLSDMIDDVRRVGEATNVMKPAWTLHRYLDSWMDSITQDGKKLAHHPRVVCLEWLDPLMLGGHWVPDMVKRAGGVDALNQPGQRSVRVDWQAVVDAAPEMLLLMPCGFDVPRTVAESGALKEMPGWKLLPAVQSGNVWALDGGALYSRPGPRLLQGAELLAAIFSGKEPNERWAKRVS